MRLTASPELTMQLREYQTTVVDRAIEELAVDRSPLIQMATGSGKTLTACIIVKRLSLPTLWVAHTRELVDQTKEALRQLGVENVEGTTVQGASRRKNFTHDLLVIDECHRSAAASYVKVIEARPSLRLGLSATPWVDEVARHFSAQIDGPTDDELVSDGFLVPERHATLPVKIDITNGRRQYGDLESGSSASCVKPHMDQLIGAMESYRGRHVLVYANTVEQAGEFSDALKRAGWGSETVSGQTPTKERADIINRFKAGEVEALCSVLALTEGSDLPIADVLLVLRPTVSRILWHQICGRVRRPYPGKTEGIVLSPQWVANAKSGIQNPHKIKKRILTGADQACAILGLHVRQYANPFPPSDKQLSFLERLGINPDTVSSKSQAGTLISVLFGRQREGLCGIGILRVLRRFDRHYEAMEMTTKEASQLFDESKAA